MDDGTRLLIVLVLTAILLLTGSEGKTFGNINECREQDVEDRICAYCLPKCCPGKKVLSLDGPYRGYDCVDPGGGDMEPRISVPLVGHLAHLTPSDYDLYGGVMPACQSNAAIKDWTYDLYTSDNFKLNIDHEEEYLLHILNSSNSQRSMSSQFDNQGERELKRDDVIGALPRSKPLMHFCFDALKINDNEVVSNYTTVALACPELELDPTFEIFKCCPFGQSLVGNGDDHECVEDAEDKEAHWSIPINGHLYGHKLLHKADLLTYDTARVFTQGGQGECQDDNVVFRIEDAFHIGPDGNIHFTDVHLNKEVIQDFCIDRLDTEAAASTEDYYYEDELYDLGMMDNSTDNYNSLEDCFKYKGIKILASYCASNVTRVRKCCENGKNINIRGRSCTDHNAHPWNKTNYAHDMLEEVYVNLHQYSIMPFHIYQIGKDFLTVSDETFIVDTKTNVLTLTESGRQFTEDFYCLDYSVDYCEEGGQATGSIRAIINDEELMGRKMSTLFGTSKDDSRMKLFKRIGFTLSTLFLLLTLAIHVVVDEIRQELGGKMVIGISVSLIVVYICLLIRSFEPDSIDEVSKTNKKCIFLASVSYFFTLASFGWMSAMSYNIMSQFSGTSRLPKNANSQRMAYYTVYSFGVPAFMVIAALTLNYVDTSIDPLNGNGGNATLSPSWRPGFGEETCWFTSCSMGSAIFLYGPISIVLITNILMFIYAAYVLQKLRRNMTASKKHTTSSLYSKSRHASTTSNKSRETVHRQYSKQLSTASTVSKSLNLQKHKANIERLSTYAKLFAAMGLTWTLEVVAWLMSNYGENNVPFGLQIAVNTANVLQGIVIFFVFAFKKTNKTKVKKWRSQARSSRENSSGVHPYSRSLSRDPRTLKKVVSYSTSATSGLSSARPDEVGIEALSMMSQEDDSLFE